MSTSVTTRPHVQGADTVVISSAVRRTTSSWSRRAAAGLRFSTAPRRSPASWTAAPRVAVAGANGKTTTTSMLVVALQRRRTPTRRSRPAARSPSSAPMPRSGPATPSSSRRTRATAPSSPTARTSRSSPTSSRPPRLLRRSTGWSAPTPPSPTSVVDGGLLVACADDPGARGAGEAARRRAARRDVRATRRAPTSGCCARTAGRPGHRSVLVATDGTETVAVPRGAGRAQRPGRVRRVPRRRRRAGGRPGACSRASPAFTGTRRRFEVRGEAGGVTVVDDYAHNPAKVAAVVGTAAEIVRGRGPGRCSVVFQPHLYSRTLDFAASSVRAWHRRTTSSSSTSRPRGRTRCRA